MAFREERRRTSEGGHPIHSYELQDLAKQEGSRAEECLSMEKNPLGRPRHGGLTAPSP